MMGNEQVKRVMVDGHAVDVIGCWDEKTPEGKFDFFDIFVGSDCLNLGEPLYKMPSKKVIRAYLEIWRLHNEGRNPD